jgi:hypothetical protein
MKENALELTMPNGDNQHYNAEWCREKHKIIDNRMDIMEKRLWGIIILLVGNLFGVATTVALILSR